MIRPAVTADSESIAKVHVDTWKHAYKGIIPSQHLDSLTIKNRISNWHNQILDNSTSIFVYDHQGEIRGFISGGTCRDTDLTNHTEVYAIYVTPKNQGQGIGKTLLSEFFKSHSTPTSLWVLSKNLQSMDFYLSNGFKPDGIVKELKIYGEVLEETRFIKNDH